MTDKQILATANATGVMLNRFVVDKKQFEFCLLAFAKQIAKYECEACAKACDELAEHLRLHKDFDGAQIAASLSFDIRARGEA